VDESTAHMAKGPYREVLDWLVEQVDRLDEHLKELVDDAERGAADEPTIEARRAAITQAHEWLADQLKHALQARGMQIAA
jgi:hypothetical protein